VGFARLWDTVQVMSKSILIVDDSQVVREVLREFVETSGDCRALWGRISSISTGS
jgi:CheY-like chemotaxis protein